MRRKFVAAFLAMALIMSGSTVAWAAEGEEDNTSGLQENVTQENVAQEEKGPLQDSIMPAKEAGAEESASAESTDNEEAETEETDTTEDTIQENEKEREAGTVSGTLNNGMAWELADGVLTISGNGMLEYGYSDFGGWRQYSKEITKIIIGEGVTGIGDNSVFGACTGLTEVAFPKGLTKVGESAFYGCESIQEINFPEELAEIGADAFSSCINLRKVSIPDGVTKIGSNAFASCTSLAEFSIPGGVTEIMPGTFFDCTSLQEIVIPDGVKRIGEYAFQDCSSLGKVSISSSVTEIAEEAFYRCKGLASVDIPNSVTKIAYKAFADCTSLPEITFPQSVKSIGHSAFAECSGLSKVTFEGDAPVILQDNKKGEPFDNVKARATCRRENQTWTDEIMRSLGSNLSWGRVGEKVTALKIVPEATDFTYILGSSGGVTIKCTGELKDFVSVYMDGVEVDKSNYTLREGSTLLTFATKYLDTLSVGKHTVTLNYTYGSVDTELTVLATADGAGSQAGSSANTGNTSGTSYLSKSSSPKTGDETAVMVWMLAAACSFGAGVIVFKRKRSV